jgi:DNA-binding MarR family transcriptional regulator
MEHFLEKAVVEMVKNNKFNLIQDAIKIVEDNDFMREFADDDTFSIWLLLDYTRFAIGRLRDLELANIGITPEQAIILQMLTGLNGKSTIGEISNSLIRRSHSISTMAHRMEKQGLVKITKYPGQKELEVAITNKGRELQGKITKISIDAIFSVLSKGERQNLSLSLKLLLVRARNLLNIIER